MAAVLNWYLKISHAAVCGHRFEMHTIAETLNPLCKLIHRVVLPTLVVVMRSQLVIELRTRTENPQSAPGDHGLLFLNNPGRERAAFQDFMPGLVEIILLRHQRLGEHLAHVRTWGAWRSISSVVSAV